VVPGQGLAFGAHVAQGAVPVIAVLAAKELVDAGRIAGLEAGAAEDELEFVMRDGVVHECGQKKGEGRDCTERQRVDGWHWPCYNGAGCRQRPPAVAAGSPSRAFTTGPVHVRRRIPASWRGTGLGPDAVTAP